MPCTRRVRLSWFCIGNSAASNRWGGCGRCSLDGRAGYAQDPRAHDCKCAGRVGRGSADPVTRFHSGVDLVGLNVVATDAQGRLVKGLASTDFTVFEDGQRQDVSPCSRSSWRRSIWRCCWTRPRAWPTRSARCSRWRAALPRRASSDRISVVEVKDVIRVLHPLNEDVAGAKQAIGGVCARGNTALQRRVYDAQGIGPTAPCR